MSETAMPRMGKAMKAATRGGASQKPSAASTAATNPTSRRRLGVTRLPNNASPTRPPARPGTGQLRVARAARRSLQAGAQEEEPGQQQECPSISDSGALTDLRLRRLMTNRASPVFAARGDHEPNPEECDRHRDKGGPP